MPRCDGYAPPGNHPKGKAGEDYRSDGDEAVGDVNVLVHTHRADSSSR